MNAIKIFQEKHNLTPDGVIGKKTLQTMSNVWGFSPLELAHFLGQGHVESLGFTRLVENMNYSAQRMAEVWPTRFALNPAAKVKVPNALAKQLDGKPVLIGNTVYGNRMGNGSDNGYAHRGFGVFMITGKSTQDEFSTFINDPSIKITPELIATKYPLESAIWFFNKRKVRTYCTKVNHDSVMNVSRLVNVGNVFSKVIPVGFEERMQWTQYYLNLMIEM